MNQICTSGKLVRACVRACVSFIFMSRGEDETRGVYFRCKVVSLSLESVAVMTFLDVLRCDHCVLVRMCACM